ncbi:unnamed protein product [Lepeophtheirus salmonis]|uniref:(salmon louse) hypothetical protein n=1 Tax=Lepeophtheirus salmonis TaxID=72036 RepID=A0A7R8HEB9_LEPSM|nr:unnamed protein product [Lepeophtheirus salmonis]CAF3045452.1 unnamed protein product [Lepeophtheirus salmonis]
MARPFIELSNISEETVSSASAHVQLCLHSIIQAKAKEEYKILDALIIHGCQVGIEDPKLSIGEDRISVRQLHCQPLDTTKSPWKLGIFERIESLTDIARMLRTARLKSKDDVANLQVHRDKEVQRREAE